jgi:predicted RNA-binding Zn ribbon-like protein
MASRVPDATVLVPAPAEELCLSFANTRYWRGSEPDATEQLSSPKALGEWLAANAPMPAARRGRKGPADGADLDALFDDALRLRESIYRIFLSIGEGRTPPSGELDVFNSALAETPPRLGISARGGTYSWIVAPPQPSLGGALAPVIWSAADLLTHAGERRIRRCANDKCRWVFVDRSKGGTRRWCDMNSCGNRAKAHRHYARSRKA